MTVNGDHIVSDVIRLCGGRNVFADLQALAPSVSLESVLQRDPEVIVAGGEDGKRRHLQNNGRAGQVSAPCGGGISTPSGASFWCGTRPGSLTARSGCVKSWMR